MEAEELIKAAMEAKEHAYVPYSHFRWSGTSNKKR